MTREVLIALILKDIKELDLLTSGFLAMEEYPEPYMQLAINKANELVANISKLSGVKVEGAKEEVVVKEKEVAQVKVDYAEMAEQVHDSNFVAHSSKVEVIEMKPDVEVEVVVMAESEKESVVEAVISLDDQPKDMQSIIDDIAELMHDAKFIVHTAKPRETVISEVIVEKEEEIEEEQVVEEQVEEMNVVDENGPVVVDEEEVLVDEVSAEEEEEVVFEEDLEDEESEVEEEEALEETVIEEEVDDEEEASMIEEDDAPVIEEKEEEIEIKEEEHEVAVSVADSIKTAKTLLESLHDNGTGTGATFASSIEKKKITDLKTALTIADRFRFQRELFAGNGGKMMQTLDDLNKMDSFEKADKYLTKNFSWNMEDVNVKDFMDLVTRRFL